MCKDENENENYFETGSVFLGIGGIDNSFESDNQIIDLGEGSSCDLNLDIIKSENGIENRNEDKNVKTISISSEEEDKEKNSTKEDEKKKKKKTEKKKSYFYFTKSGKKKKEKI